MEATKKHAQKLELIENYLTRSLDWLHSDKIEICRVDTLAGDSVYTNSNGQTLTPIFKQAGSKLQFIELALKQVRAAIKEIG